MFMSIHITHFFFLPIEFELICNFSPVAFLLTIQDAEDTHLTNNENTENTWLTSSEAANPNSVTNHQPMATLSQEVADSYIDFDLPGSPTEDFEYARLLEVTSPTPQDVPESGYVCASPLSSPDISEAANCSRSSSDERYFDVESSDVEQRSLQSNDFYDCEDSSKRDADPGFSSASDRSLPKGDRLRVIHNIFHSLDSDSCSESLPKSQSTSGSICTALSSASNQTLHDTDETDFCSLRDDVGEPKLNGECSVEVEQNGHKEQAANNVVGDDEDNGSLRDYEELETKLNAFKPVYRKVSRQERKDDTEMDDDAKLINNVAIHESTPEITVPDDNDDHDQPSLAKHNGHLSPIEDEEEMTRPQRIRRCSSLKTGKTPPGTPGRKKIVRFADMMGLDLADVRTFLDEVPRVPKCAYEDLEVSLPQISQISMGPRADKILMPMFQQPGAMPNFLDLVQQQNVALENAAVTDPICLTITGSVRVRNLDFHKSVHLRYSTDGWRSFADMQATYVENSCDGFSDKFTFILFGNALQIGERIEIAVRFSCKGQQFWDNNFGVNYCFQCLPATAPVPPRINTNGHANPLSISPDDAYYGSSFY